MENYSTRSFAVNSNYKATLLLSVLLLLFIQTFTIWLESIYRISLTKLAPGLEIAGLLFIFSPFLVFVCPEREQRKLLGISLVVFLTARSLIPFLGVAGGVVLGGAGVGAFLVLLCLLLSQPFRYLRGEAGIAFGVALLMSIALRAWGATYDDTLSRSGAALGWLIAGLAVGLFWNLSLAGRVDSTVDKSSVRGVLGPIFSLFGSITVGYLVLSSPGVVEAWLGFDNPLGTIICVAALGGTLILLGHNLHVPRSLLVVWNLLFGVALVGGILALRIKFPDTPASPAVVVRPGNTTATLLLNLMFALSPVVLLNVQAACRSLGKQSRARRLAVPVILGIFIVVLLSVMSIFTNVWGYVGPVSAIFRNQFHVPFLLAALLMLGALFLPGWEPGFLKLEKRSADALVIGSTVLLVLAAFGRDLKHRPLAATAAPGKSKQLTILSYNMQQGSALGGNRNWEEQLSLIRRINADIVGLQESDTPRPSDGNVSAAKYFGTKLGYYVYYGPNTVSGTYGTAILSRFPIKNPRTFFTFSDQDEVGTAVAEFEVDGKTFAFFNSHPSGKVPRKCHAAELVKQAMPYEYAIAVGDYNASPQEESYHLMTANLKDSWVERYPDGIGLLHPNLRPRGGIREHGSSGKISSSGDNIVMPDRIDHILLSRPFNVIESYYLPAPASQTDHPAHWAVVGWD